jgi:16S rRNA (uracil1498-N3)-methyltransferase
MSYDFTTQRLFVASPLSAGARLDIERSQANYLLNVLRMGAGDPILVFNGTDGEWRARIETAGKKSCALAVDAQTRPQTAPPDIDYLFAPLKHARLDYIVQKAVEMGVARLRPVLTRHTQAARVNLERMEANAVEAAEQCGVLTVPKVMEPEKLDAVLAQWDPARRLIVCDEGAPTASPLTTLAEVPPGPLAILIGPEGGFAPEERQRFTAAPFATIVSLGPRILRADTAGVAALALIQAKLGDWR